MSLSPFTVALGPIVVAMLAALTFVASMDTDAPAARPIDSRQSQDGTAIQVSPSVTIPRPGVSGSILVGPELTDLDHDGVSEAAFGTESGFYQVADGEVLQHIPTSTEVTEFTVIKDISSDGVDDIALALGDTTFPNVRVYDAVTGEEIWTFIPAQEVFVENLMWTSQQTSTFDLLATDVDGDSSQELFVTSGYRLYALDAATGETKWNQEWLDNLWRVTVVEDLNGDGTKDLLGGSQDGYLVAVSGSDGSRVWQRQVAEPFQAIDEKGGQWKQIDRSVWDIVEMPDSPGEAIFTSEDGYVRRINLDSGKTLWEQELISQPAALLSQYYRQRGGHPTGPGDLNFFNLRAGLISDISGDGRDDLLVTAFLGAVNSQDSRNTGIFAIDSDNGRVLWRNSTVDVTSVSRLDIVQSVNGPLIGFPGRNPVFIDLKTGNPVPEGPFTLPRSQDGGRQGTSALLSMGSDDFLLASASGDLAGATGGTEWSIPRVTESQLTRGDFTGDGLEDILVWAGGSNATNFGFEARSRLVYVIDGETGELAWEYLVPFDQYVATGGIAGVRAVADLTGDGKQDVIGYMQDVGELTNGSGEQLGENSRIVVLDGASGETILNAPSVQGEYYGIWDLVARSDSSLTEIIRGRVTDRIGGNLANEWQSEEQRRRDQFESGLGQRWDDYRVTQVQQFVAENGSGESNEELRAQNQQVLDDEWANEAGQRLSAFEAALSDEVNALRQVGANDSLVTQYESQRRSDRVASLEQERIDQYAQWEAEFENDLATGVLGGGAVQLEFENTVDSQRFQTEQTWRDEFESSLGSQRSEWIDEQTGGSLDSETQAELQNLQQQLNESGSWLRIDKRIVSVDVISHPGADSGVALLVAGARDVFIVDLDGEMIWTRSYDSGVYNTPLDGPEVDMSFGLPVDSHRPLRAVPDRNGDGYDDLRVMTGRTVMFAESSVTDGELRFVETSTITGPAGTDRNGAVTEIPDLNLDGVADVALIHWRDNAPAQATIVDGVDGTVLLNLDNFDENSVTLTPTADFNGDSRPDVIMFERWVDGKEGPRLRVLSSGSGSVLWEFAEFRDLSVFDQARYSGPIIPATAVDDMTGDGVPELAIVKHLTWQPGGSIDVYDIARDELVSHVVTEESNPNSTQEERWHPGLLARGVGDLNGDGIGEIAYVSAFGSSPNDKQHRLSVADLASGEVIADFAVTGSSLVELQTTGKFGLAGANGDLYLLDVNNELSIKLPNSNSEVSSPLILEWEGTAPGSFNQVFVDGVEVARTNGEAIELNLRAGDYTVGVRSLDPSGRGIIAIADISVSKSQVARNLVLLLAVFAIAATFWVPGRRMFERARVRMAASG